MQLPAGWYIFYYHDVSNDERVPLSIRTSPQRFEEEIRFLRKHFDVVPFNEGLRDLRQNNHVRPRASVCFDDGFRGVLDRAVPVLKSELVPHILFLNSAFLDGEAVSDAIIAQHMACHWSDQALADFFPEAKHPRRIGNGLRRFMHPDRYSHLWAQVKDEIDVRGIYLDRAVLKQFPAELTHFGSHTRRHYWLAGLSRAQQEAEIAGNRDQLKELPGFLSLLALPFGTSDCFDEVTLAVNDEVHGDVVIKAVGGIDHSQTGGRWFIERIGMSDEKPRIDDLIRDRVTGRSLGYRLRKLGRKARRIFAH
jgi:peptidoglycan/xylan/chitin deacetylase (PgdA/CDA1 family)